jgi:hypothetical protein
VAFKQLNDGTIKRKKFKKVDAEQKLFDSEKKRYRELINILIKRSYENDLELFLVKSKVKKT